MVITLLVKIPVSPSDALHIAGAAGRLQRVRLLVQPDQHLHVLVGLIGGTFLMLSYFGTDQSQVQRYLAAKSVDEARSVAADQRVLEDSAAGAGAARRRSRVRVLSIPASAAPVQPGGTRSAVRAARTGGVWHTGGAIRRQTSRRASAARALASQARDREDAAATRARCSYSVPAMTVPIAVRTEALAMAAIGDGQPSKDVNYIIPRFVLDHLPIGLAGLFIAAVIAAAMNAISGELNSLVDHVGDRFLSALDPRRGIGRAFPRSCRAPRRAFWGVFACIVATYAVNLGSLIEVVNRFGSFFYGSILGVFLLAMIPSAPRGRCVLRIDRRVWFVVGTVNFGCAEGRRFSGTT